MRERMGRGDPTDGEGGRLLVAGREGEDDGKVTTRVRVARKWRSVKPTERIAEGKEGLRRSATRVSSCLVAYPFSEVVRR